MKVLVTGATGFVGKVIVRQLLEAGDQVVVLTRNVAKGAIQLGRQCQYVQWADTNSLPPAEAFAGVDGVINLMGEGLSTKRWNDEQKKRIYNSRIDGTARLVEAMSKLEQKPKVLVSTSAIGVYGDRGNEELTEAAQAGNDFLSHVCRDWEREALKAQALGMRVGIMRVGVVLGRNGGALAKMLPIFKKGVGGPLGSGKQYMSWIHVEDLAGMYIDCLKDNACSGAFNCTSAYPATNAEFTKALGKVLKRPALAPAPAFVLRKVLGEMATIVLSSQRVLPNRFKEKNFRYRYPTLEMALKETAF
jgi:uncharacterized protein